MRETSTGEPLAGSNELSQCCASPEQFSEYCQRVITGGINKKIEFWPVSFTGTKDEIKPVRDFLDHHAGYQSFCWTPPVGEKGMFRSFDIIITPAGNDIFTLTSVFEQAF